jgi:citrate lyase synthetase
MIQKSAKRVEKSRKSNETRDEIEELVNRLVELEYKEDDTKLVKPMIEPLYGEGDFLGISKFSLVSSLLPNKRNETQRYIDFLQAEIMQEDYLDVGKKWEMPPENFQSERSCKCLQDFYNQHSKCS